MKTRRTRQPLRAAGHRRPGVAPEAAAGRWRRTRRRYRTEQAAREVHRADGDAELIRRHDILDADSGKRRYRPNPMPISASRTSNHSGVRSRRRPGKRRNRGQRQGETDNRDQLVAVHAPHEGAGKSCARIERRHQHHQAQPGGCHGQTHDALQIHRQEDIEADDRAPAEPLRENAQRTTGSRRIESGINGSGALTRRRTKPDRATARSRTARRSPRTKRAPPAD